MVKPMLLLCVDRCHFAQNISITGPSAVVTAWHVLSQHLLTNASHLDVVPRAVCDVASGNTHGCKLLRSRPRAKLLNIR